MDRADGAGQGEKVEGWEMRREIVPRIVGVCVCVFTCMNTWAREPCFEASNGFLLGASLKFHLHIGWKLTSREVWYKGQRHSP